MLHSLRRFTNIVVLLILSLSWTSPIFAAPAPFPDMAKSWFGYQDSVSYLVGKGSISGYPDGNFHPTDTVNRAEFLKLVFRSRGAVEPASGECFADVPVDAWFAPYVCAAKRRGIVSGYKVGSRTIFKPAQPINFAEAIKMIVLAYGSEVQEYAGEHWYAPYVDVLSSQKILSSWSYIPWEPINRERAADLIARFVRHEEDRAVGNLSLGCGKAERSPSLVLTVNGLDRQYLLTKADDSNAHTPSPLIVAFHGRTNSNEQVRKYFGLDRAAINYFIAYPAAIPTGKGSFTWSDGSDKASQLRDFAFFDAIVKEIGESECIDLDRIFVVGHSLGAWFANSVACARGGIVRGSATVGGSTTMTNCTGPSAALIINNPKDGSSPHASAERMRDIRIAENACAPAAQKGQPESLSCVEFRGCPLTPVVFCPHTIDTERDGTYYPHVWPPGTAQAIVGFFDELK